MSARAVNGFPKLKPETETVVFGHNRTKPKPHFFCGPRYGFELQGNMAKHDVNAFLLPAK